MYMHCDANTGLGGMEFTVARLRWRQQHGDSGVTSMRRQGGSGAHSAIRSTQRSRTTLSPTAAAALCLRRALCVPPSPPQQRSVMQNLEQRGQPTAPPAGPSTGAPPALLPAAVAEAIRGACDMLALPPRVPCTALTFLRRMPPDELPPQVCMVAEIAWHELAAPPGMLQSRPHPSFSCLLPSPLPQAAPGGGMRLLSSQGRGGGGAHQ